MKQTVVQFASFACAIHCLILPLLVVFIPYLGLFTENPLIELILLITSIACGSWIIYSGYCVHKRLSGGVLFVCGGAFWIVHVAVEHLTRLHLGNVLMIVGTCCVLGAYYINTRSIRSCSHSK